ncbi:putative 2OG-Fe(II) oxygenase [Sphingomonas abietis]|uniref:2OG-Fe(II) oxygenase n=1 Tax=Sphingomonas abietis TaxID=3012344 RepID=A0ABY7NSC0_9SPHN|nr:putative 2OG-Fe(II) oxygenase [Sphingomonas abietis]WBO22386.1 putative 2OG-Fe(II) oxygenase [Sphingomonas abietis]
MNERRQIERRLADPRPLSVSALADLSLDALDHGLFEAITARITQAIAAGAKDARLYQILGLARRGVLDGRGAVAAFEHAVRLAPKDALVAHGLARSTWEAGIPATAFYDRALRLAPTDASMLVGRAAALVAEQRGNDAIAAMTSILEENPGWHEGHAAYARIHAASRMTGDGTATVRAALARYPGDPSLWRLLLSMLLDARRYVEATEMARAASSRLGEQQEWRRVEAIGLSEAGEAEAAQRLFDRLTLTNSAAGLIRPLRNLIRMGRFDEATAMAERAFPMQEEVILWPYRSLLWRLVEDDRWHWLEGNPRLVGVYDLGLSAQEIAALADMLRALHRRSGEFLDQSVRGGTQTDGNLLARAEPEIRQLRDVLLEAVSAHIAQLPPAVVGHPTLIDPRAPVRIAGAWSVRLSGAGFHVDHVHPQGWLSSAFYVALPNGTNQASQEGWLAFGECRDILPTLDGFRQVEPAAGRLVLFPSTMWHGTRPFPAGERMTVAFDIARP